MVQRNVVVMGVIRRYIVPRRACYSTLRGVKSLNHAQQPLIRRAQEMYRQRSDACATDCSSLSSYSITTRKTDCNIKRKKNGIASFAWSFQRPYSTGTRTVLSPSGNNSADSGVDLRTLRRVESLDIGIPRNRKGRGRHRLFRSRSRPQRLKQRNPRSPQIQPNAALPPPPFAPKTASTDNNGKSTSKYKVVNRTVKVLATARSMKHPYPKPSKTLPEVALMGRSNVGKSSLLNALLYTGADPSKQNQSQHKNRFGFQLPRGKKASTSDRPGETKQITWYQITSRLALNMNQLQRYRSSLWLVDLPGYGFAYGAATEDGSDTIHESFIQHYVVERGKSLKRVLLLVDARHGLKKADEDFFIKLESTYYSNHNKSTTRGSVTLPSIQIVLTKCDLVSQIDLARRLASVRQQLLDCLQREPRGMLPVILTSARNAGFTGSGRRSQSSGGLLELQRQLASLCPPMPVDTKKS